MRSSLGRGLRPGVLGTFDTVVMAVAGTAPAYSIAAATAVLAGAVGVAGPAALLYCVLPMLGIVIAFGRLGRLDVSAGAAYAWVGRTLHPFLGFLSGWALVVSTTLFMVAGSLPAGAMTLALFDPGLAADRVLATAVGAGWFLLMLLVVLGGIRMTVRAQLLLSGVELALLAGFVTAALVRGGGGASFDWSWFGFAHFDGASQFASGALIATFCFWGWDVTSNLSEETRDGRRTAGLAALIGVGVVFVLFEAFTIAVHTTLTAEQIHASGSQVLSTLGEAVWPGTGGQLLVLAVLLSTVATLETTLIQVTRSLFAMGRDRTMPAALGTVHRRRGTPWVAVAAVGTVALVLFAASAVFGTVGEVLSAAVAAIGLQIAFYYGLAGIAAVVAYRRTLLRSVREFLLGGVWPLAGALFMLWIFFESLGGLSGASVAIGLGGLAAGVVPLVVHRRRGSTYYRPGPRLDASRAAGADDGGRPGAAHPYRPDRTLATDY
ncbi:APC family permease [Streptomyces zhihengii]|uniref:APC family permease n=1 Tax=Streptomyces zhihengii TaxID=1818004 RepID=A0ABS2USJ1_9ACTN|nr:APC family permease [Streptomyces zhihengii]MBM9620393.1 APC family permease [Streptomyces zhihengii]